jgi:hypothetical protein
MRLSASIKLTLHKALFSSITTDAYPVRQFAADTYVLKVQRLERKVIRTTDKFPKRTPIREMHVAFKIPHVYESIEILCRHQAEVL